MNGREALDVSGFRDPELAHSIVERISHFPERDEPVRIMEVCGTHTMAIGRFGLRSALPASVELISGPGCPVCVTDLEDIDTLIALSRIDGVALTTFGDLLRIPGSTSSLTEERASGADIRVVYSPLDALGMARTEPETQFIFAGVGFETTVPLIASAIQMADEEGLDNFSVYSAHKTMPAALEALMGDPDVSINGLILPGHVSTIIGEGAYHDLAEKHGIPGVIAGFEPIDILAAIEMLLERITEGVTDIGNAYRRAVRSDGNPEARRITYEVFEESDAVWNGLGRIPGSGLAIREEYARYDAARKFTPDVEPTRKHTACRCGDVLKGIITPKGCPLFSRACTPERPYGPCMVSSEGSCAAYYRYERG